MQGNNPEEHRLNNEGYKNLKHNKTLSYITSQCSISTSYSQRLMASKQCLGMEAVACTSPVEVPGYPLDQFWPLKLKSPQLQMLNVPA
jgi:hypothetical protein